MRGLLILAISSLLSSISATCVLPAEASYGNPDPKLRLSTVAPSGENSGANGVCEKRHRADGRVDYLHWRCAYGPALNSLNCRNDYKHGVGYPSFALGYCHVDTTTDPPVDNGVWACTNP